MTTSWDDGLLIGNSEIDYHHRQIFAYFEKLSIACMNGMDEEILKNMVKYLGEYVNQHFRMEEEFMKKHNYPNTKQQLAQHAYFRQSIEELLAMDMKNMPKDQLLADIYRKLTNWFSLHIKQSDQQLANYILAQQHY